MPDLPSGKGKERIWFHAVSVGEVVASLPILREIRRRLPTHEIVLSVTTSSGHQTALERASGLYNHLIYFPIDVARFQLSAMQTVRPKAVIVMETELWLNFLWAAKVFDAKTFLFNGRISDRTSGPGRFLKPFYGYVLGMLDRCLMQTHGDADRVKTLGARSVQVCGNCKFDQALEGVESDPVCIRNDLGIPSDARVVVVGSTRGEEEERFVLEALKYLHESTWIVYAPRHLERADAIAEAARKFVHSVSYRSKGEQGPFLLLDTYGELSNVYAAADVVVLGGGFAKMGGQNLIQPLAHGKPVLHGPHMSNFRDVAAASVEAGCSIVCRTPVELRDALVALLSDSDRRLNMGKSARALVAANTGASARMVDVLVSELEH